MKTSSPAPWPAGWLARIHPLRVRWEHPGSIQQLNLRLDQRGNVAVDENYMSSVPGVFAAVDMRRGQSLVVWAISEGRCAAHGVDKYLMGRSELPFLKLF